MSFEGFDLTRSLLRADCRYDGGDFRLDQFDLGFVLVAVGLDGDDLFHQAGFVRRRFALELHLLEHDLRVRLRRDLFTPGEDGLDGLDLEGAEEHQLDSILVVSRGCCCLLLDEHSLLDSVGVGREVGVGCRTNRFDRTKEVFPRDPTGVLPVAQNGCGCMHSVQEVEFLELIFE